jgi:hypothetical protein
VSGRIQPSGHAPIRDAHHAVMGSATCRLPLASASPTHSGPGGPGRGQKKRKADSARGIALSRGTPRCALFWAVLRLDRPPSVRTSGHVARSLAEFHARWSPVGLPFAGNPAQGASLFDGEQLVTLGAVVAAPRRNHVSRN